MKFCNEIAAILHLWSAHLDGMQYNDNNYGVGVECQRDIATYALGTYRNSYNRQTMYAMMGARTNIQIAQDYMIAPITNRISLGVFVGAVSGYEETPVLAGFEIRYTIAPISVAVQVVPFAVAHLAVGFTF